MSARIESVRALEVLDSQGHPTVRAFVTLSDGITASAIVAAGGGSAGSKEVFELRDGDPHRYGGRGVLQAVAHIERDIAPKIIGFDPRRQAEIDRVMIELDGTPDKGRLGANAILAVSMAVARAGAAAAGLPLHAYLGGPAANRLPLPMMNVINGGVQANNNIDLEEFMVVPVGAPTFSEAIRYGAEVFHALGVILRKHGFSTAVDDEGGFAPTLTDNPNEKACELIVEAIIAAGFRPGEDVAIAIDAAAGQFFANGVYDMRWSGQKPKTRDDMVGLYGSLIWRYPVVCIEDGLAEDDWAGFAGQMSLYGWKIQIVGDDLYATNSRHIAEGVAKGATNTAVIRLGQVGTVTEAIQAVQVCRDIGWGFIIADRVADTEDTFTADFAVAMCGGQIKCGSTCRGERIAKYNRLLEIEAELGARAVYSSPLKWQPWRVAAAAQGPGRSMGGRVVSVPSNCHQNGERKES
jgi:enolase